MSLWNVHWFLVCFLCNISFILIPGHLKADEFHDISSDRYSANPCAKHSKNLEILKPIDIIAEAVPMANLEGEPSAFVGKYVNVITGDFNDFQVDMVLQGIDPLKVERSYSGSTKQEGSLCAGWNLNLFGRLDCTISSETGEKRFTAVVAEGHGATSFFEKSLKKDKSISNIFLSPAIYEKGVTNTTSGRVSGQTNIKNTKLNKVNNETYRVITGDCGVKEYQLSTDYLSQFRLTKEIKPSGNTFNYYYLPNKPHNHHYHNYRYDILSTVQVKNPNNKITASLEYVTFNGSDFKKFPHKDVIACDGRKVCYHFEITSKKNKKEGCLLKFIERPDAPWEAYSYIEGERDVGSLIRSKSGPEGRFVQAGYYKKGLNHVGEDVVDVQSSHDSRINRVKVLRAPVGADKAPVDVYRFYYQFDLDGKGKVPKDPLGGATTVLDALNHKTIYIYDQNHRLNEVEKFNNDGSLYSRERLNWGANGTDQSTNLLSRTLESGSGFVTFARTYEYDLFGNVLQDRLLGNLSGSSQIAPSTSGTDDISNEACESYCRRFTYSTNGLNLLLSEEDDTHKTIYQYCWNSNRVSAKFFGDHKKIYRREFYEYNADLALIKETIDDGSSNLISDLTGVTERHIKYYTPRKTYPVGLPQVIVEKCLDLTTGLELLVHKTVNTYTKNGLLEKQAHYDSKESLAFVLCWEYDSFGNVVKETDPLSRTITRNFDANGNCVYEQGPNPDFHKEFSYDLANRLVREEEVHADGVRRCASYRYNVLGQIIANTDHNGNETIYSYDEFGRVINTILPSVIDEFLVPIAPSISKSYDLMGNVVSIVDACGNEKKMSYTVRGQLASVIHSDGSGERSVYNLDGSLQKTIAKNGTTTSYTYDTFGRAVKTEIHSISGELLSTSTAIYNSFHLLSETDPSGLVTEYAYYPTGMLKSKRCGECVTLYTYDTLGRLQKSHEYYGSQPEDVVIKVQEHDLLNRVIEERIEDFSGKILSQVNYRFDINGNVCEVRSAEGDVSSTLYDSHGTPVLATDAEGNKTITTCDYNFVNSLGQRVSYKECTDPLGNQTCTTADALGRIVLKSRKNSLGCITQKNEIFYDANGNCTRLIDTVFSPDATERQVMTAMAYDSSNRLIECIEAAGVPDQKCTRMQYNAFGQKTAHVKADGVILNNTYDALGRLASLRSSDGTVHYVYHYDVKGNPIKVDDLINRTSTIKQYDELGRLAKEVLGNGHSLCYLYDNMGRPTRVSISDEAAFSYNYRACFLEKIQRLKKNNEIAYEHQYTKFDRAGRVTEMSLIGKAGPVRHKYDVLGRHISTSSNHWSEVIRRFDAAGNLLERVVNDDVEVYSYDDLYQLKAEEGEGTTGHVYQYDSHYNRLLKDSRKHTINSLHQVLDDGFATYTYDLNGNLTKRSSKQKAFTCQYDALDRLVLYEDDAQRVRYVYDEGNRRLGKLVFFKGVLGDWKCKEIVRYLYQGQNEIGAVDEQGKITELRLLGAGKGAEIGSAVAIELGAKIYAPIHDHAGHVVCLVNSADGKISENYRYTAFGEELFEEAISPWRFASKRVDKESGLVYFGLRYYDACTGRWVSQDPLGREGGINLYAYVLNSPLTHFDHYGLFGFSDCFKSSFREGFSSFSSGAGSFLSGLIKFPGQAIETIGYHAIPIPGVKDAVECVGWTLQGKNPMDFTPGWKRPHSQGYFHQGAGHVNSQEYHMPFNGMCTEFDTFKQNCAEYSKVHHGVDVYGVYNATHGFALDLLEVCCQKIGIPTHAQAVAERETQKVVDRMGANGTIIGKPHSQGCETVFNLSRELRMRMDVETCGPARVLNPDDFKSVKNYVCKYDFVTYVADPIGLFRGVMNNNVTFVEAKGCLLFTHCIKGPTYGRIVQDSGNDYMKKYGWVE